MIRRENAKKAKQILFTKVVGDEEEEEEENNGRLVF